VTDRDLAATVLTPRELEAWQLSDRGLSERAIALALDISRSAVRSRLENARRKLHRARRKDAA
jgi:DNA-binding CsgD family transcriptional regulator